MPQPARELEASVEEYFDARVRRVGGQTLKLAPMEAGVPDRLVLLPGGRIYLVELKREGEALEPAQRAWHARAKQRQGIYVFVVTGRDQVAPFLRHVLGLPASPRRTTPAPAPTR